MLEMNLEQRDLNVEIPTIIHRQRQFFQAGNTLDIKFRIEQLKTLKQSIVARKDEVLAAVYADLHKPDFEAYATEIGVIREIDYTLKHLKNWVKPQRVSLPIDQLPGRGEIQSEPLGVVLIVSPWNYPFQLAFSPLIGAIAAGNCAIIKPSEISENTSKLIAQLVADSFDPSYITVIEGGIEVSQKLLAEKFDHIFFTGGTAIGKIVMEAAAKHLVPVTLELGGKSPCIVDQEIDLDETAKRILWGKFLNAGQTCIAPDYLFVHRQIKPALVEKFKAYLQAFYGDNPAESPDYARIINTKQFNRLVSFLNPEQVMIGGQFDRETRYIAPTVIEGVSWDAPIMQDEIFGPILPILEYQDIGEAIAQINRQPKPLALYLFSRNSQLHQHVLQQTSSGGVCINDTIMQVGVPALPFGGVGNSGLGRYHGKASFDTFSHQKSVLKKTFAKDFDWRYAPYKDKLRWLKWLIG